MKSGVARLAPILCCAAFLAALIVIALRLSSGAAIDTNIQSVLPRSAEAGAIDTAIAQTSDALASRVAFLVEAPDNETALAAAADLESRLAATGIYQSAMEEAAETAQWIFANRDELMCGAADEYDAAAADRTRRNALAQIYSVTGMVRGDLLVADPFLRTQELVACFAPAQPTAGRANARLVSGVLTRSAYEFDVQEQIIDAYEAFLVDWSERDVSAARTGSVFFAAAAAGQARADVTRIGVIGAIGVLVLFGFVFLRLRATLSALAVVGFGLTVGIGSTLLVFPAVNVLVFVFAAMLVGIASDYAIHALATGPATGWQDAQARRRLLLRPTLISLATTVLGFGCLALFGISLLQQVALMAGAGLIAAWVFVLFVVVPLDRSPSSPDRFAAHWSRLSAIRQGVRLPLPVLLLAAIATIGVAAFGAGRTSFNDDVRTFQARPAELMADEDAIRGAGLSSAGSTFLYTEAETSEAARIAEAEMLADLPEDVEVLALSRFDPPASTRSDVRETLARELYQPHYTKHAAQLGLEPSDFPARLDDGVERPSWFAALEGEHAGRYFLAAPIISGGVEAGTRIEGSVVVDPVEGYADGFAAYRGFAVLALGAAVLGAAVVVVLVYRRFSALVIVACPALALLVALLAPAALGLPVSFFTLAAGLVLLGVGLDYAAFEWEAGDKNERWTSLAVTMDAFTTLLSMGLLALSATIPVRDFGTTIVIGVAAALALSGLARIAARRSGE